MKRFSCLFKQPVVVQPGTASDWKVIDKGRSREYRGAFIVRDGQGGIRCRVRGRIVEWTNLPTDVYLYAPRRHRHGSCRQLVAPNDCWFKLHWDRPARDAGTSIVYVEQLLQEALIHT